VDLMGVDSGFIPERLQLQHIAWTAPLMVTWVAILFASANIYGNHLWLRNALEDDGLVTLTYFKVTVTAYKNAINFSPFHISV